MYAASCRSIIYKRKNSTNEEKILLVTGLNLKNFFNGGQDLIDKSFKIGLIVSGKN